MTKESVLVAMSGGVDSAVTALLLKEQGYTCMGATMKLTPPAATLEKITKSCFLWEQTAACNSRRAVCITGGGWKLTSASWKQRSQPEKQQQQQQR